MDKEKMQIERLEAKKVEENKKSVSKGPTWIVFTEFGIQVAILVISIIQMFS
jgi:hypothetical protein